MRRKNLIQMPGMDKWRHKLKGDKDEKITKKH